MNLMMLILLAVIFSLSIIFIKAERRTRIKLLLTLVSIVMLLQFPLVQKGAAAFTAMVYVMTAHHDKDLEFEEVEYGYGFGNYFIRYSDPTGKPYNFQVSPKFLPINIVYDPFESRP